MSVRIALKIVNVRHGHLGMNNSQHESMPWIDGNIFAADILRPTINGIVGEWSRSVGVTFLTIVVSPFLFKKKHTHTQQQQQQQTVPATSIVLGTLFASTVNVLWNRQLQIRSCINKEVGELRLLRRALFGCFGTAQHAHRRVTALGLTHRYVQTLVCETQLDGKPYLQNLQAQRGIAMNEMDGAWIFVMMKVYRLLF